LALAFLMLISFANSAIGAPRPGESCFDATAPPSGVADVCTDVNDPDVPAGGGSLDLGLLLPILGAAATSRSSPRTPASGGRASTAAATTSSAARAATPAARGRADAARTPSADRRPRLEFTFSSDGHISAQAISSWFQ
jgi:hypothetical protein